MAIIVYWNGIKENKNGHFEGIGCIVADSENSGNSTLIYLSFDTHDSPGAVFV